MSDERLRFAILSSSGERSMADLCREFGISRQCGYTWLKRYREGGAGAVLVERSRRPQHSPTLSSAEITAAVMALRQKRSDWGARKIHKRLPLEHPHLTTVSRSTVHRILLRQGAVRERDRHRPATKRFQREAPNELWQMDFKGPKGFRQKPGPLSVLDDHSRYLLTLEHLASGRIDAVRPCLERTFENNGMPEAMLMDHGTPWWNVNSPWGWTELSVWLMRQGIRLHFSGYRHPQTQGKVERMHNTLHAAIRKRRVDADEQSWLDEFREEYNQLRPHEALGMRTPAEVWRRSEREYRAEPQRWEYGPAQTVLRLDLRGEMRWAGRRWTVSMALKNELVGVEQNGDRALVYYCNTPVVELDVASGRTAALGVDPFRSLQC